MIFPHTSNWDFFLMLLYVTISYDVSQYAYFLVKPQPFAYFEKFLYHFNCIAAPKKETRNNGFVEILVNKFKDTSKYYIFLSPKGTRSLNDWRSGYYAIAKNLQIPIFVIGLDYYLKQLCVYKPQIDLNSSSPEDSHKLFQSYFSKIPQLHPECENYIENCDGNCDEKSNKLQLSPIDWFWPISAGIISILIYIAYRN